MSEYATTERLGRLKGWICEMSAACAQLYPHNVSIEQRWYDLQAATDAFEKSISTPIPLAPSDEMVESYGEKCPYRNPDCPTCYPNAPVVDNATLEAMANAAYTAMRAVFEDDRCEPNPSDWKRGITAALNLMGGR